MKRSAPNAGKGRGRPTAARLRRHVKALEARLGEVESTTGHFIVDKTAVSELIARAALNDGMGHAPDAIEKQLLAYSTSVWVMAITGTIASAIASLPLVAEARRRDGKWERDDESELSAMLASPGNGTDLRDVVEQLSLFLELTGTTFAYAETTGDLTSGARGRFLGMRALRPSQVEIKPGGEWIESIEYTRAGSTYRISPDVVGIGRYVDPNNDYWGVAPWQPMAVALDIDGMIMEFNRSLLDRGGVPDIVAETDKTINAPSARRMKNDWENRYGRHDSAGGLFIADGGLKLRGLGIAPKDMQFFEMGREIKSRLLAAYGTPPAVVSDFADASVLANAELQIRLFYGTTLKRKAAVLVAAINRAIARLIPGYRVRVCWEEVAELQPTPQQVADESRQDYDSGIVTLNEARALRKLDPVAGGDDFKSTPIPFAAPVDGQAPKLVNIRRPRLTAAMKGLARAAHRRALSLAQHKALGPVRQFFEEEAARVLARLEKLRPAGAKVAGDDPLGDPLPTPDDFADSDFLAGLFDTFEEADAYRRIVGPIYASSFITAGHEKGDALGFSNKVIQHLNETHSFTRESIARWGASHVVGIMDTTRADLNEAIKASFEAGESGQQLQARVREVFDNYGVGSAGAGDVETRIERIARTEMNVALNEGGFAMTRVAEDAGAVIGKSWLSLRDSLVRDSHAALDDATSANPIPLGEKFGNGLLHPGDSDGDASEIINCRCTTVETVLKYPDEELLR